MFHFIKIMLYFCENVERKVCIEKGEVHFSAVKDDFIYWEVISCTFCIRDILKKDFDINSRSSWSKKLVIELCVNII